MRVAAIMPCRGRAEQTVRNVRRLLATAGTDDWELWCVVDDDAALWRELGQELQGSGVQLRLMRAEHGRNGGYWYALAYATEQTDAPLLVNLANDLIPGQHWLARALRAYDQTFGPNAGMLGFNGDSHEVGHSCHFVIDRHLLAAFGGWPVWYQHNFGDTELCQRAIAIGAYAKAPWALLFHDHPYFGGDDDAVYAEGRATSDRDAQLYHDRQRANWPPVTR